MKLTVLIVAACLCGCTSPSATIHAPKDHDAFIWAPPGEQPTSGFNQTAPGTIKLGPGKWVINFRPVGSTEKKFTTIRVEVP